MGSTKTRLPIFTDGKYLLFFHSLNERNDGRVSGSGKTSSKPVFTPTN